MNTRLSANLSVLGTSLMLILSFSFGFHSYTEAKKTIVTDLNQALQQTILQNSHLWMSQDSIRTYANLSKLFGNPVSIESYNKDFSDALSYTPDKKKTGIVIHVLNKDPQTENAPANANKKLNEYYIASDTDYLGIIHSEQPQCYHGSYRDLIPRVRQLLHLCGYRAIGQIFARPIPRACLFIRYPALIA